MKQNQQIFRFACEIRHAGEKGKKMKRVLAIAMFAAVTSLSAEDPGIVAMNADDLSVCAGFVSGNQRYPWNGLVDIDFSVLCLHPGAHAFIELSAFYEDAEGVTNNIALSSLSFGGEALSFPWATTAGTYRVVWNAAQDAPGLNVTNMRYRLKVNMARYMVLSSNEDTGKVDISYLEAPDFKDGTTQWKDEYKTTKMALRLIQPHENVVGSAAGEYGYGTENCTNGEWKVRRRVRISKPYYIGIYEVTRAQMMSFSIDDGKPYELDDKFPRKKSYDQLRGSFSAGINWPKTGSRVAENSVIWKLRRQTGDDHFDLPTDAQWELAARAGYDTPINTGNAYAVDNSANRTNLIFPIAQCVGDVSVLSDSGQAKLQEVGLKTPNRWGLYDCHGNVYEYVLDVAAYDSETDDVTDPLGAESSEESSHFRRGGSYLSRYHTLLIGAHRDPHVVAPSAYTEEDGFRLCWSFSVPSKE